MSHLTSFEVALVIISVIVLFTGIINFIWNITLKHYKDDKTWKQN